MSEEAAGREGLAGFVWRCAFGFHRWEFWGAVRSVHKTNDAGIVLGRGYTATSPTAWTEYWQDRTCACCGLTERRER